LTTNVFIIKTFIIKRQKGTVFTVPFYNAEFTMLGEA